MSGIVYSHLKMRDKDLHKLSIVLQRIRRFQPIRIGLEALRLSPTYNVTVQFTRSLIVSTIAFIIDFCFLMLLKEKVDLYYLLAATISYSIGLVVNYLLSNSWVFTNRKLASRTVEFTIFTIISIIGLIINVMIMVLFVQGCNIDYRIAKVVATVVVFFWNFTIRKKILY